MKIKIVEILNSTKVLEKISKQDLKVGNAKLGYLLYKNIQNINKEIRYFEEAKNKIINKYGKKDKAGNYLVDANGNIKFKDNNSVEKELNDVLQLEVDCDINELSLEEVNNWSMSALDISKIAFMIKNE